MDNTTPPNHPPPPNRPIDAAERLDVLISHIIDADGAPVGRTETAWREFSHLAQASPGAWRELAIAQRDHAALAGAVAPVLARADHVELPEPGAHDGHAPMYRLSRWSGWAAAAMVALAWIGAQMAGVAPRTNPGVSPQMNTAGLLPVGSVPVSSTQEAISAYKELGQRSGVVLGEIPERVIIESRPIAGGRGYEVVYLRQFMERAQVPELYQVTRDDSGQQGMLMPVSQPAPRKPGRID